MGIFRNGSLNFIVHLDNLTEWGARQLKGTDYKQRNAIRIVLVSMLIRCGWRHAKRAQWNFHNAERKSVYASVRARIQSEHQNRKRGNVHCSSRGRKCGMVIVRASTNRRKSSGHAADNYDAFYRVFPLLRSIGDQSSKNFVLSRKKKFFLKISWHFLFSAIT